MVQENELITLLLGIGVLVFAVSNRLRLQRLPEWKFLVGALGLLFLGWILTILEGFFWESALNLLEHISYAASSVLLALWCWKVFPKEGRPA
jgi:hypothetical protein